VYHWKIRAVDSQSAASTSSVWTFRTIQRPNTPPNVPSNPNPVPDAEGLPTLPRLSWTGGDPDPGSSVQYDVYLGRQPNSSDTELVSAGQTATYFVPNELSNDTRYYWRIVATDEHGFTSSSPIWNFKTIEGRVPHTQPAERHSSGNE
jgi:hypothetical protein